MQLTEHGNDHPNLISQAETGLCHTAGQSYNQSIIVPWDAPIETVGTKTVRELDESLVQKLCDYQPEIIVLATGEHIEYPDTDLLLPLVKNNIGLEVMTNAAAARTFNVLMSENRQVLCLFLIA
ncbi:Mth938-like domain-containing protein [Marinicella rhabdoformis]|uniref:Mth938-like domain-containing protein n=1 Tax=Marinicella rhabdoformis TaxID=2580566 RepID=UPI0012AEBD7E|nr:MTH938/NDUFAF3 family protein [Marinicella rhabdoformis]